MNILQKSIKHFFIITHHKIEVFKTCIHAGLFWQGIIHDLSKYSLSEFIEYAQYYNGEISPVDKAKQEKGYCLSWLHHRGRNPHHYEYWIDNLDNGGLPLIMPYKYAMEMVCDYIGAGKAYEKGKWTIQSPLNFWLNKKKTARIHPAMVLFFDHIFKWFAKDGYNALNKEYTKIAYKDCMFYDIPVFRDIEHYRNSKRAVQ